MMREKLVASDFLAKDVLNLESGDLIGAVTGVLVAEEPMRVIALAFINEAAAEAEQRLIFCDYSMVTDVDQQVVVVSSCPTYLPSEGKILLDYPALIVTGNWLGVL